MSIEPFTLPYSDAAVADLRERLARTRWPDAIVGSGWEYGADLEYLRGLCRYWQEEFDWKARIEELAAFDHHRYRTPEMGIHFIHQRGKGPRPMPLLITHGWPGSILELAKVIPRLADPARFGGDPADAFDVVAPSLPGFGFSDRPARPGMNLFRIAALGLRHAGRLIGIHLNYIPGSYRPYLAPGETPSAVERACLADASAWGEEHGAYAHVQRMEPQTLAYGLNDSPAGLAAWLVEKFRDWADCGGDVERRFTRDELLANVTLYWMTQTIHSSCRLYFEGRKAPLQFQEGESVEVPCGIAHFPKELPFPTRSWIERGYRVVHWSEMPSGGHFAAAEEPELLAADVAAFFRGLR